MTRRWFCPSSRKCRVCSRERVRRCCIFLTERKREMEEGDPCQSALPLYPLSHRATHARRSAPRLLAKAGPASPISVPPRFAEKIDGINKGHGSSSFAPWATICGRCAVIVRGTAARGPIRARRGRSTEFNAKQSVINTLAPLGTGGCGFELRVSRCREHGIAEIFSSSFDRKTAGGGVLLGGPEGRNGDKPRRDARNTGNFLIPAPASGFFDLPRMRLGIWGNGKFDGGITLRAKRLHYRHSVFPLNCQPSGRLGSTDSRTTG